VGGTPPQGTRDSYAAVLPAFNDALDWLDLYTRDGGNYIIVLGSDQAVNNVKLEYGGKRVAITLAASGSGRTVKCDRNKPSDSLFTVEEGVTFTLEEGVTISGAGITTFERKIGGESSLTLVRVRGRFIMNGGAVRDSDLGYNTDCAVRVFDSGDFTMNAGTISGNHGGGGVWVGGTFTMNGGVISGNTTWAGSNGGGVVVVGTFTMNGGTISENSAFGSSRSGMFMGGNGGSVYVYEGTFTMTGGAINGSSADYGGGIGLAKGATFTMTGGEISGNTARNGGGIYMYDELSTTACTFTMSGGAINGNTARNGGGVYVVTGAFTMKGGDISGNSAVRGNNSSGGSGGGVYVSNSFTLSGGAIGGNSASDNGGGVYVAKGETFTKSDTGGIVYGSNAPAGQANKAPSDAAGHAVYVDGDRPQKRVTTAGETTALDSRKNLVAGGGWE
jgi:hypothetical protein